MARFEIDELFNAKLVLRHKARMMVWCKILNLGRTSTLSQLARERYGYTPSSNNTDFWFNLITNQPDNYFSMTREGIVFTEKGEAFKKELFDMIAKKYPIEIVKVTASDPFKKKPKKDNGYSYRDDDENQLTFHTKVGDRDIYYRFYAYNYDYRGGNPDWHMEMSTSESGKDDFSQWGNAHEVKPFIASLFDSDALTKRFIEVIPEEVKLRLSTFILRDKQMIWRQFTTLKEDMQNVNM